MFTISSKSNSDISNIIIKTDSNDISEFTIKYISDFQFELEIVFFKVTDTNLTFINKHMEHIDFSINILNSENCKIIVESTFKLLKEVDNTYIHKSKIPKIIHQSYKPAVKKNMFNVIFSWKLMNINYEYKYWDDDECKKLISSFDTNVQDAYDMLYAGAYKSDIFRLCVLYKYGGVWSDVSSECKICLDKVLCNDTELIIVKDTPSQVHNGNIYQAFIACVPENNIIKEILDFTVDRVLNNDIFNSVYPYVQNEPIAVTGPTIFAMGFNKTLGRHPYNSIINDDYIKLSINGINTNVKLLVHLPGNIYMDNEIIIKTKYNNWQHDRTNTHYSVLFEKGYIYKKKINDITRNNSQDSITLYQIWIQSNFVSINMENAIKTWIDKNPSFNYKLITNKRFLDIIKNNDEFPLLEKAYKSLIPLAFKSDLIRIYMLYKYGGFYADIDSLCINSVEELCKNYDIVLSDDTKPLKLSNAFIYSKKNQHVFKILIEKIIDNVIHKKTCDDDLDISGPGVFGKVFRSYFNIDFKNGEYNIQNTKIKVISYNFDLPIPGGSWKNTSRNIFVKGNILFVGCRSNSGTYKRNKVCFSVGDSLENNDGKIVNNNGFHYEETDGSGLYYDNKTVFAISKYSKYNDERLFLDGNDFAKLYKEKNIFG